MKHVPALILSAVLALLVVNPQVFADGKFFSSKAYRTSPTIHSQRAILKYKDGIETLVIESSFDGEGEDFGWIIPLPSKPSKFEQASKGFLKTLSETIQPWIIHGNEHMLAVTALPALVILIFFVFTLFSKSNNVAIDIFGILIIFLFGPMLLLNTDIKGETAGPSSSGRRGVDIIDARQVGSLELMVLQADNPETLNNWLTENGFTELNNNEKQIILEYINEGWCFVTAKLKRDGQGYAKPHPLAMTFKSEKPIYPMRLTGAAASDVFLELFVIANNLSVSQNLTTENASLYSYDSTVMDGKPGFIGNFRTKIGHPDNDIYLWDQCVISRLCGILKPEQMKQDIIVNFNENKNVLKIYFSRTGALTFSASLGLRIWCVSILILIFWFNKKSSLHLNCKSKIKKIFIPPVCLFFILSCIIYCSVEKVEIVKPLKGVFSPDSARQHTIMKSISAKNSQGLLSDCTSISDVEKILKDDIFIDIKKESPYLIKEIKLEDSPGNVTVLKDDRGLVIRVFGRGGFHEDIELNDEKTLE